MPDIIPSASAGESRPEFEETHPAPCWYPYYPDCTCYAAPPRAVAPVPVPIPDSVAVLIGSQMPIHVLQAEIDAESAAREVLRFRGPLLDNDDRHDRELALSELALNNKILAAYNPRLILKAGGSR